MARWLIALAMIPSAAGTVRQEARPGWFWLATCGGPMLILEVQLDNRTIHKATFPVCRANRDAIASQGANGRIEFSFRPDRAIVWQGYRDRNDRTAANEVLVVSIWQAGADPDAMILGMSVVAGTRIVMNTVHIAQPAGREESTIAKGLVVRTYPPPK